MIDVVGVNCYFSAGLYANGANKESMTNCIESSDSFKTAIWLANSYNCEITELGILPYSEFIINPEAYDTTDLTPNKTVVLTYLNAAIDILGSTVKGITTWYDPANKVSYEAIRNVIGFREG